LGRYVVTATGRAGTSSGSSPVTGGNLTDNSNNPLQGNTTDPGLTNVARFTIVLADVPATVTGVQATPGDRAVSLTWAMPASPIVPITNYVVEYATGGGSWQPVSRVASAATIFQVTGLTNGVSYSFRVAAVNGAGQGTFSEATAPVTPRSLPSQVLNLQAVAGNASATLNWALPTSDGGSSILDYLVQSSSDGQRTWQTFNDGVSTTRSALVTGLTNGTTYSFRVAATTAAGQGAWAVSTPVTVAGLPTAVLNVVATAGDSQAILTWTTPTSTGGASIVDYAIQRSSNGGDTWTDVNDGVSTANTATVTGLVNGTAYVFRVAALNGAGTGPYSVASAPITPRVLPSAPLNLQAEAGDSLALLTWTAPSSEGSAPVLDYLVQSSGDNGVTWTAVSDGTSTATTATVTGLTNGAGYLFRVAAVSAAGQGSWATVSNVVTPVGLPSVPTNVAAAVADGQAVLTWSSPTNTGGLAIVDYVIQSSSNGGATWLTLDDDVSGETGLTVPNLTNGIAYMFRVAAVNSFGAGEFSDATAPQTSLAAPQAITNLIAVAAARSVTLTWDAPASTGGRPLIDYAIDYRPAGSADWVRWNRGPSTATSAVVTGLPVGRGFAFRVTAVTDYGSSAATESAGLVVCMTAPTRLTGRALNGAVALGWSAPRPPAGTRIVSYQIQYSTNGGATWTTVIRPASALPRATVGGLRNGTAYVFRVAAVTTAGVGAYSARSTVLRPRGR
jgi:titin